MEFLETFDTRFGLKNLLWLISPGKLPSSCAIVVLRIQNFMVPSYLRICLDKFDFSKKKLFALIVQLHTEVSPH
jgi:hypothetical protein